MNMNQTATPAVTRQVRDLTVMALFTAIVLIMAYTPIGIIDLPLIKATILHVPVVIGAVILGPKKGAFLGFLFGLTSLMKNIMTPSLLSFAFTPTVPVPGTGHGTPWAIFICFVPRILIGVVPWYFYSFARRLMPQMKDGVRVVLLACCGALGAITNTALVMGTIYFALGDAYAIMKGIPSSEVLGVILGIVFANGVPEMLAAAVIVPVVSMAIIKSHVIEVR